ncbi:C45 family autoproteolytic acyltransferase/hydrolase [Streptomyces sp. NPDC056352]|uniref:C45 family autoproteolytic acyltransferase/hydolase n=1 Tax=Streptomyces sp. NPDC056352 TaxID=3345791 RepID=UPI0035E117EC
MHDTPAPAFPRIRVRGTARERGVQYGARARPQVHSARDGYERSFAEQGLSWPEAVAFARRHLPAVTTAYPELVEEMAGIAEGAGLPFEDIFTINCRTEILWWAQTDGPAPADAAHGPAEAPVGRGPGECTSFALAPHRTADGVTLVAQNWDWLVHGVDSVVVLEVEREGGPNFVTLVEAGLLAKTTLNAHGVGIALNTLISSRDDGSPGIPVHVLIRALADCRHVHDAVGILAEHRRASSGNYLVGAAGGAILDIECLPGGPEGVLPVVAENGVLTHTNHFLSALPAIRGHDLAVRAMPDSYVRLGRIRDLVPGPGPEPVTLDALDAALRDHTDAPSSICCHPDERSAPASRWTTVMSVVIDLEQRALHLSEGNPCATPRLRVDYADLLRAPTDRTDRTVPARTRTRPQYAAQA